MHFFFHSQIGLGGLLEVYWSVYCSQALFKHSTTPVTLHKFICYLLLRKCGYRRPYKSTQDSYPEQCGQSKCFTKKVVNHLLCRTQRQHQMEISNRDQQLGQCWPMYPIVADSSREQQCCFVASDIIYCQQWNSDLMHSRVYICDTRDVGLCTQSSWMLVELYFAGCDFFLSEAKELLTYCRHVDLLSGEF